ncbi:hypothetical protein Tco_0305116 [Tanacetum coccineum]
MMDVASQRVARSQHRELCVQREIRQIRRFKFYDRPMPNTYLEHQGHLGRNLISNDHQMAGALGSRTTARNLESFMRDGGGQEEGNGNGGNRNGNRGKGNGGNRNGGNRNRGNENGGNRNGNGNGGGNGYNFGGFMPVRECTHQDFLKCQPLSFNGKD